MPQRPLAVKTIVTTPMAARVAEHYGVELIDVLTGFKFIGEQIGVLEQKGEEDRYLFGFEESYGYLSGTDVRDKDAVDAALQSCEMFAWYKSRGKSLLEVLDELYERYGFYQSRLLSFAFEGSAGFATMQAFMDGLRREPPAAIAGHGVIARCDYLSSESIAEDGSVSKIDLPKSNVLRYFLEGGMEAVARPSGTEPKLKIYLTAVGENRKQSGEAADELAAWFQKEIENNS